MESDKTFQEKICSYCFQNLENYYISKQPLVYPEELDLYQYPLFVTYYSLGSLRGCIGTFRSEPLGKNLQSYSLIAALNDRRFPPIG